MTSRIRKEKKEVKAVLIYNCIPWHRTCFLSQSLPTISPKPWVMPNPNKIVVGGAMGVPKVTFYIPERTDTDEPLFLRALLHERRRSRDARRSPCSSLLLSTLFFSLSTAPLRRRLNLLCLNSLIPHRCAHSFSKIALSYPLFRW